jgi:hypothetical protein
MGFPNKFMARKNKTRTQTLKEEKKIPEHWIQKYR